MKLSPEHKAALAQGRHEAKVVRHYLTSRSRRDGRSPRPEELRQRIEKLDARIAEETSPMKRLRLHAEKNQLVQRLAASGSEDADDVEKEFIAVAKSFSERRGIPYAAWREEGVPAKVLNEAGVTR